MLRAVSPVEIVLGLEGIGLDVLPQELHRDLVGHIRGGLKRCVAGNSPGCKARPDSSSN